VSPALYRKEGFGRNGTAASPSQTLFNDRTLISFPFRTVFHLELGKEVMFSTLGTLVVRAEKVVLCGFRAIFQKLDTTSVQERRLFSLP